MKKAEVQLDNHSIADTNIRYPHNNKGIRRFESDTFLKRRC